MLLFNFVFGLSYIVLYFRCGNGLMSLKQRKRKFKPRIISVKTTVKFEIFLGACSLCLASRSVSQEGIG